MSHEHSHLRGNDVHCNPVLVSYLLIEENETHYFIQPQKIRYRILLLKRKSNFGQSMIKMYTHALAP